MNIKRIVAHIRRRLATPVVISLGWVTMKYFLFTVVGLISFFAGLRTLKLTTFEGYEPIWSLAIAIGACVGMLATLDKRAEWIEGMAAYTIVGFLLVLIASLAFRESYAVAGLCSIVMLIPLARGSWVAMHIGKMLGTAWKVKGKRP